MTPEIQARFEQHQLSLPKASTPAFGYLPVTQGDRQLYVSGKTPKVDGVLQHRGRLGRELDVQQGADAARTAALSALATVEAERGLERVVQVLKVVGYVACTPGFDQQSQVIEGASQVFRAVLGDAGAHARTAIGVAALPGSAPVELDVTILLDRA